MPREVGRPCKGRGASTFTALDANSLGHIPSLPSSLLRNVIRMITLCHFSYGSFRQNLQCSRSWLVGSLLPFEIHRQLAIPCYLMSLAHSSISGVTSSFSWEGRVNITRSTPASCNLAINSGSGRIPKLVMFKDSGSRPPSSA